MLFLTEKIKALSSHTFVADSDKDIHIFNSLGLKIYSFSTKHKYTITDIAFYGTMNENEREFVTAASDGTIIFHSLKYTNSPQSIIFELKELMTITNNDVPAPITHLISSQFWSTRLLLVGFGDGTIKALFGNNGTLLKYIPPPADTTGIQDIILFGSDLAFVYNSSQRDKNNINLLTTKDKDIAHKLSCPLPEGTNVLSVTFDLASISILYALTATGDLFIFENQKNSACEQIQVLPIIKCTNAMSVKALRGYLTILCDSNILHIYNISKNFYNSPQYIQTVDIAYHHTDWAINTNKKNFITLINKQEGKILFYESLFYVEVPPPYEFFKNPIFIVGVIGVIIWQCYRFKYRSKKKGSSKSRHVHTENHDEDSDDDSAPIPSARFRQKKFNKLDASSSKGKLL